MLNRKTLLIVCSALPLLAGAVQPPEGAVVFRFDDNHTLSDWTPMQKVFQKHQAPMCLGINPMKLQTMPGAAEFLQQVVKDNGEIMDHTPTHSSIKIEFNSEEEAQKYKADPGVERIEGKTVFLKLCIDRTVNFKPEVTIQIKNNQIIPLDANAKKHIKFAGYLEMPDGKVYGFKDRKGVITICTPYYTPCSVPDQKSVKAVFTSNTRLHPTDDALRLLAKVSRSNFEKMGLPAPSTFLIPGGSGCYSSDLQLAKIYGKEFGYTAGDSYNVWGGVYGRKDKDVFRFTMAPCWDSLERKSAAASKHMIADMVAQHRVVSFISHLWYHTVQGGKDELLKRNDELLSWLRAKKIPILTMKQASTLLFDTPFDPSINVMPNLFTDLDEDKIPDGYTPGKGATAENGILKRNGSGNLFTIKGLTCVAAGKNVLKCKIKAPAGTKITFALGNCGRWSTAPAQKQSPVTITLTKNEEEISCPFSFPGWAYALQIRCDVESSGNVEFSEPSLTLQK